jgi:hypothetical protein
MTDKKNLWHHHLRKYERAKNNFLSPFHENVQIFFCGNAYKGALQKDTPFGSTSVDVSWRAGDKYLISWTHPL